MCLDNRAINRTIVKYRFLIPKIGDLLDQLRGALIFSKIDLKRGYYQIRVRQEDGWKTTFKTIEGLFKWLVMPFKLTNVPNNFIRLMNQVHLFLNKFVIVYFNDSLVFSRDIEKHYQHLHQLFQVVAFNELYLNLKKCILCVKEIAFLGFIVGENQIKMNKKKIEAISSWLIPTCTKEVQAFISFASFYQKIIQNFSFLVAPITNCLKKGSFV